jgi:hypothetical protein
MPAQDIGPIREDWAYAAFDIETGTITRVISRTDSKSAMAEAMAAPGQLPLR